jgi:osmotically-inducible protein OsmY
VSADDGVVTLAGMVGSVRQKREAGKAAERVHGVVLVNNELDVWIRTEHRREDADLRRDVLQALALDDEVPATVDVRVDDGFVTLVGTARWQHERDEAEFVAGNVLGVTGVDDAIDLLIWARPPTTSETRSRRRFSVMPGSRRTISVSRSRTVPRH